MGVATRFVVVSVLSIWGLLGSSPAAAADVTAASKLYFAVVTDSDKKPSVVNPILAANPDLASKYYPFQSSAITAGVGGKATASDTISYGEFLDPGDPTGQRGTRFWETTFKTSASATQSGAYGLGLSRIRGSGFNLTTLELAAPTEVDLYWIPTLAVGTLNNTGVAASKVSFALTVTASDFSLENWPGWGGYCDIEVSGFMNITHYPAEPVWNGFYNCLENGQMHKTPFDHGPDSLFLKFNRGTYSVYLTRFDVVSLAISGVPEPEAWALMLGGFCFAGIALRRRPTPAAG